MSTAGKIKVLLIDDEKFLLEMYSLKFLKSGFDVITCSSAEEALATLAHGYSPDVILTDITMPDKSGYQFLETVADMPLRKHCLVIALTNEGQDGEIQRMLELGADAHILKAKYTPAELVTEVSNMLAAEISPTVL